MSDLPVVQDVEEQDRSAAPGRDADLLGRRDARTPVRLHLDELFTAVAKGFEDQHRRSVAHENYWDCYNCETNGNRYYNGIAEIYMPIIHDAVEALVTRWVNQMFPSSGRYVEAIAADGSTVSSLIALLDHYIRQAKFQTHVAAPLVRNGIVEGQLNLYVDWNEIRRQIVSRETHGPRDPMTGQEMPGEAIEDVVEEDVIEGMPVFEVLHDCDVLILPATADSVDEALAGGGSVTIVRRWSKAKIDKLAAAGVIRKDEAKILRDAMGKVAAENKDIEKHLLDHVHIKKGGKEAQVWETWTMLPLKNGKFNEDGEHRLCRVFYGPGRAQLGAKRNPYWNDRCPLLSAPLRKMAGVFKGPSLISYVDSLQYEANDAVNEGADAATLSAAPIITRDTSQYNGPLVYNVGAVWDAPPDSLKMLTFPDLTPRAAIRVQMATQAIFQALGVNPAMLPQQTGRPGAKRNQAEVALEQQVDLLTTAIAVSILEEGIMTPAMAWAVDLDYQFRDRALTVRKFGELGKRAQMEEVAPLQNRSGFTFIWRGGNQVRQNAMMMQQGTAWLNVMRGLAPQLMQEGLQLRIGPIVEAQTQNIFGPELGAMSIVDQRAQLSIPQDEENKMLAGGFEVPVHPLDQDEQHIPVVMQFIQQTGDPHGVGRLHAQAHLKQRQMKAMAAVMQAAQQQMMGQQQPGAPAQGGAGQPQPGAAPAGPRLVKGPPGMIPPDQMSRAGAMVPPRRT